MKKKINLYLKENFFVSLFFFCYEMVGSSNQYTANINIIITQYAIFPNERYRHRQEYSFTHNEYAAFY